MKRGTIPVNKDFELEYRYYDRDANYRYFNRKFEIYLLEKKMLKKNYVLHMDNADTSEQDWMPHVYKASNIRKKNSLGVTTLNWNDMKNSFLDYIVSEIGEQHRDQAKKAMGKVSTPRM